MNDKKERTALTKELNKNPMKTLNNLSKGCIQVIHQEKVTHSSAFL